MSLTKSLSKWPSLTKLLPCPRFTWKAFGWPSAFRHYSFCKTLHLICLTVLLSNFYSDFMLHNASDTLRIFTYSTLCFFKYMPAYSAILSVIETYSHILRHTQSYSGIFSTLCNPHIFTTLPYSKTLTRHIQNSAIGHYSAIFRHIQNVLQRLHTQILAYLESWNTQNTYIITSRRIFRTLSY